MSRTVSPKRSEWVIRAPRETNATVDPGKLPYLYVDHFERSFSGVRYFSGFRLKHSGYDGAAFWLKDALRFRTRQEAAAFLILLKAHDKRIAWRIARVDVYRVVVRKRRERAEPTATAGGES